MKTNRFALSLVCALVVWGVGCRHEDTDSDALLVRILEPHSSSTHFPGDVSFDAEAMVSLAGPDVGPNATYSWEIRDASSGALVASFQGRTQTITLSGVGSYVAGVTVRDPDLGAGATSVPFQIGNTIARIQSPDPFEVQAVADQFTLEGYAETRAPNTTLGDLTFSAIDEAGNTAFMQTVTPPAGSTQFTGSVGPALTAGLYRLELVAETTDPAQMGTDAIDIIVNNPPAVTIVAPTDGATLTPSSAVDFEGTVVDTDGQILSIEWTSSIEGSMGSDLTFSRTLSRAKHTIRLTATDDVGLTSSDTVDVYIEDAGAPLFTPVANLPGSDVEDLAVEAGSPDTIWVAFDGDGSYSVAGDTAIASAVGAPGGTTNAFSSAAIMADGRRLFGTRGDGVAVLDAGTPAWLATQDVASSPDVTCVAQTGDSQIWIGTVQGLTRTDDTFANGVTLNGGPLDSMLLSIADDGDDAWIGTDGEGLVHVNGSTLTVVSFRRDDGLADNVVWGVAVDGNGVVWAGTDEGLSRYDATADPMFTSWDNDDGLSSNTILDVAVSNGIVWLATSNGATRLDPATGLTTVFRTPDLPNNNTRAVVIDSAGGVWFGTANGGLVRYDGQ